MTSVAPEYEKFLQAVCELYGDTIHLGSESEAVVRTAYGAGRTAAEAEVAVKQAQEEHMRSGSVRITNRFGVTNIFKL